MSKPLLVAIALACPAVSAAESHTPAVQHEVPIMTVSSFDFGATYVHTPERAELLRIARLWRQRPAWWTITLEGHGYVADDEEASIAMGTKRAERVRDLLVKYGVDPRFVVALGHSRSIPGRYVDLKVDICAGCKR
jgi:outer membrane protein OmpA-like peptidoglycan-associated protein